MKKTIAVFCSSSSKVDPKYLSFSEEVGRKLSNQGYHLVFGGTATGCMKSLASSFKSSGGFISGVIPKSMNDKGMAFEGCDELIVMEDLLSRKRKMMELADAFLVLPGGIGTIDELTDILASKQCKEHNKPIYIFNYQGFFNPFIQFLETLKKENFAYSGFYDSYFIIEDIETFTVN